MSQDSERFVEGAFEWPNHQNQDACPAKYKLVYILNALTFHDLEEMYFHITFHRKCFDGPYQTCVKNSQDINDIYSVY